MVRIHVATSAGPSDIEARAAGLLEDYLSSPDHISFERESMPDPARGLLGLIEFLQARVLATFQQGGGRPAWGDRSRPLDHPSVQEILRAARPLQVKIVVGALREVARLGALHEVREWNGDELRRRGRLAVLLPDLVRVLQRRQPFTRVELTTILDAVVACPADSIWGGWSAVVPLLPILRAVERDADGGLSPEIEASLRALRAVGETRQMYTEQRKLIRLIDDVLHSSDPVARLIDDGDDWGVAARQALIEMDETERADWLTLLAFAATARGTSPTGPWQRKAAAAVAAYGEERFKQRVTEWLALLRAPARAGERYAGRGTATHVPTAVFTERNGTILRGLLWCCAGFDDASLARAVAEAAELCLKKIPNIGARSVRAGNAAIGMLGRMPGAHGLVRLQRLGHTVKQPSARALIASTLAQAAARAGVTPEELEERAVPDFGLRDGRLRAEVAGYQAEIAVAGAGRVELRWLRPDGTPLRAEPAAVKREAAAERAALRRTVEEIRKALPAQRDRIERLLLLDWERPLALWRERYLDQPLLATLTRRLIWRFGEGDGALGIAPDGEVIGVDGRPLPGLTGETRVRLWHPLESSPETVLAWQRRLEEAGVTQPFKQAHREVYLLTDAERTTETYSNRFAAHILRQHQLKALCDARGWRYSLQGGFDSHDVPTLTLPHADLTVQFWVDGGDGGTQPMSEAGIYLYVITDQVRFLRGAAGWGQPLPLAEVPPRLLSEAMRDVDLFVGVASVGNDPTWQDSGPREHRAYWQEYAFGDLSASAQTRHAVLARLLPRLAIAERCTLDDRFLVVRGERRTYRIHLGSGNILMEPNNQYLCIVPARGGAAPEGGLFLPFEGDGMLSLILSKAFLLARDSAITDPTITRQLANR